MAFFKPDRFFQRISCIDPQRDVLDCGFTHVLLDIDNTILTRDTHEVPIDVQAWLDEARESGIEFCLVSNNFHHGVFDLAERLGMPIVAKSVKPLPFAYIRALKVVGVPRKRVLCIGDQLITDVLGAHFMRMRAYMLLPLVKTDLWHTLLLRHVEAWIMGDAKPERGKCAECVKGSCEEDDATKDCSEEGAKERRATAGSSESEVCA